jgi:phage protein D
MFTNLLGIRLLLLFGRPVPLPPSADVMKALTGVEVTMADDGDGFQLTFTLAKDQLFDFSLLRSGALNLFNQVVIASLMGVIPEVLINGVITHHQIEPSPEPGRTSLVVTGRDPSVMMSLDERNATYPNQLDSLIVQQILLSYADTGMLPVVTPTVDLPLIVQRIPVQAETDLAFIKRLARRNGYVFHVNPTPIPGQSLAVFAPELRLSVPSSALNMNTITTDNLRSIHFSNDALAATGTDGSFIEPITKLAIPIPPLPSLRIPPLTTSPTPARRTEQLRQSANETPSRALVSAAAAVSNAPEPVTATGDVDTARYGSVLRARSLVGVRGVGLSYDGIYYLRQVTHQMRIGEYSQSFVGTREGTGTLLPAVVP